MVRDVETNGQAKGRKLQVRNRLIRRGTAAIVAASATALLLGAAPAGAGSPKAKASAEDLVSYLTKGKLKPAKRIAYQMVCSADCSIKVTSKLKLAGPDLAPTTVSGSFQAGQIAEAFLKPNGPALKAIKANIGAAKLVTSVTATSLIDGTTDTDKRTFKFKK